MPRGGIVRDIIVPLCLVNLLHVKLDRIKTNRKLDHVKFALNGIIAKGWATPGLSRVFQVNCASKIVNSY